MKKLFSRYHHRTLLFLILSVFVLVALITSVTTAVADSRASKEPPLFPGCTPETDPGRIAEYGRIMGDFQQRIDEITDDEELINARDELLKLLVEQGFLIPVSGPEAKGIEVTIAGKTIRLPDDAYIARLSNLFLFPDPGMSEEEKRKLHDNHRAVLEIRRGNSFVNIGWVTGDILWGGISPKEEQAFDFLKEAFPEQSAAIDALPILSHDSSTAEVTK